MFIIFLLAHCSRLHAKLQSNFTTVLIILVQTSSIPFDILRLCSILIGLIKQVQGSFFAITNTYFIIISPQFKSHAPAHY